VSATPAGGSALPDGVRPAGRAPLRLGGIALDLPAVQAALSNYSDLPMRRVARAHGAPFCFHEVVLDRIVLTPGKESRKALDVPDDDHPVGGQLMGSEPATFARAAREMVDAGYDLIDVNFGCPVPRIRHQSRGGFLLGEPATALAIVDAVVQAVAADVPVMVKLRRGLDDSPEAERDFFTILAGAFARGIAGVTVHGRTVAQRYEGPSRWSFLARVKREVGAQTVLGSGDLFSPAAVLRMLRETGVDGVTVARGCIGNPWIFAQCRALLAGGTPLLPSLAEQRAALVAHFAAAVEHHGAQALAHTRRHAIQYARLHPTPVAARDAFARVRTPEEWSAAVAELYDARRFPCPARPLREEDVTLIASGAAGSCAVE
jgi:nifR3 family TIM-barrel protein